jgi:hypothetical protein
MASMRTTWALAAALAGLGACSNDSGGRFFIVQNQVPEAGCVINTNRNIYTGEGVLDLALVGDGAFAYLLFPLLQNDFPAAGSAGAPEPNRMFVRAFRVRVEPGAGAPGKVIELFDRLDSSDQTHSLIEFQEPWAATIDPGGGMLAAGVGAIPGELARQLRSSRILDTNPRVPLTVRLRAVGKRRDGDVESDEFAFPVRICQDCLANLVGACPHAPVNLGNPCNPAQDAPVDCCQAGAELTCPANAK